MQSIIHMLLCSTKGVRKFICHGVVDLGLPGSCGDKWVVTILKEKGQEAGCQVLTVVVSELCDGQPVSPVHLHVVKVQTEVLFQFLIDSLGLSICHECLGHLGHRGLYFSFSCN
jgi:hypothetical protein